MQNSLFSIKIEPTDVFKIYLKKLDEITQYTKQHHSEWNEWAEDPTMGVSELCNCYLYDADNTLQLQKLEVFDYGSLHYISRSCTQDMLLMESAELYTSITALESPQETTHFYPPNTSCYNNI